jgi:predicted ABC-type ATPase
LAGINGTGKTEILTGWKVGNTTLSDFDYVCWDILAEKYGSDLAAYKQAARELRDVLDEKISQNISFCYEVTLSSRGTINDIARIKDAGYRIDVFYSYVLPIAKVIERINNRQNAGQHGARGVGNPDDFRERFQNSLKHLNELIDKEICDTVRIFDNSEDIDLNDKNAKKIQFVAMLNKDKVFKVLNNYRIPTELQEALPFS